MCILPQRRQSRMTQPLTCSRILRFAERGGATSCARAETDKLP